MPAEPAIKRAVAFFDGQNLFHAVKRAFGYTFPNYDPRLLAEKVCATKGWTLTGVRSYTDRALYFGWYSARVREHPCLLRRPTVTRARISQPSAMRRSRPRNPSSFTAGGRKTWL